MERPSKIGRLPANVREKLNHRLRNREQNKLLIQWLNSLPETQALLAAEFDGQPINAQNFSDYKRSGSYSAWLTRQHALDFMETSLPDDLDQSVLEKMSAKLIRCLQIRYAAVAGSLPAVEDNPELELKRLGDLCQNLTALRRGDLAAERLSVEQQRLALEKARSEAELEKYCWEWTKRPDVQARLYPHRAPDQIHRDVDAIISHKLLGTPFPKTAAEDCEDPAIYI